MAIAVQPSVGHQIRNDAELARIACDAIDRHFAGEAIDRRREIPRGSVKASVADGWITLRGTVDWLYQTRSVEQIVHDLPGVNGVTDLLDVRCSRPLPSYSSREGIRTEAESCDVY